METNRTQFRWRTIGVLLVLLLAALRPVASPPTLASDETGELIVVVWPTPNVQVRPGELLTYQIQAKNFNRSGQSNIRVYVPYDSSQLTIVGTAFEGEDDWLSELSPVHALVVFPDLAGGQSRTATLYARVANDLPPGTVITTWPSYSWSESDTQKDARSSNAAPVVVGATNELSPYVWMNVWPSSGPPGTTFGFFSDRLFPFEDVEATLIIPGTGPVDTGISSTVNGEGRVWLEYASSDLPPGSYEFEVRGLFSNLTARTTFVIE